MDRGDGILALIHPVDQVPKTALLGAFVPALSQLLVDHNGLRPNHRIRLRAAVPLVLVVSDDIYRSVIRHGYDGIDDQAFEPLVRLRIHGHAQCGWIRVPAVPPVTGDRLVDTLLHHAGQELDAQAAERVLEPAAVAEEIMRRA